MKNGLHILLITLSLVLSACAIFAATHQPSLNTGGIPQTPSYNSASSTAYTIGDDISVTVLDEKHGRGYASFCNTSINRAYVVFGTSAVTSTSSADVLVPPGECYEIRADNRYVGAVQAIQETSTSTTFLVTELLGS